MNSSKIVYNGNNNMSNYVDMVEFIKLKSYVEDRLKHPSCPDLYKICKEIGFEKLYKKFKFHHIFNFAAQAGVRYSFINPRSFIKNNISGFFNILNLSLESKVKKFFYASSSSVYEKLKNSL